MGEKYKHVETKQHSIQKPMSQRWNQKGNQKKKKNLRQMKMEMQLSTIYGIQQNQF